MLKCLNVKMSKYQKGFTLIGAIMAIGLIIALIGGVFLLIYQSAILVSDIFFKHKAAYLAQEGIEIVRNIRDTNWLKQRANPAISWDKGLNAGEREADYNDLDLVPYQGRYLKINDKGFYNYDSGVETKFKRKITIQRENLDEDGELEIRIWSRVKWEKKAKKFDIVVQKDLYNWKP